MRGCLAMRALLCCGQGEAEPRQARTIRGEVHPKREACALGYRTIGGNKRRVFVSFDAERDRPFRSPGVLKEVATAHILQKSVIQVVPYGAGAQTPSPTPVVSCAGRGMW